MTLLLQLTTPPRSARRSRVSRNAAGWTGAQAGFRRHSAGQRGSDTQGFLGRYSNVTIYEHHRVSADHDATAADGKQGTHALVDRLTAGEAYAVAFGGQGGAWLETLEELVSSSGIESELATLVGEVDMLLEPVARELVVVRPI